MIKYGCFFPNLFTDCISLVNVWLISSQVVSCVYCSESLSMACDSRQNSTLNSVLYTFHFVTQIVFCGQIVKIKFYFVFQILLFWSVFAKFSSVAQILFYFLPRFAQIQLCFTFRFINSILFVSLGPSLPRPRNFQESQQHLWSGTLFPLKT